SSRGGQRHPADRRSTSSLPRGRVGWVPAPAERALPCHSTARLGTRYARARRLVFSALTERELAVHDAPEPSARYKPADLPERGATSSSALPSPTSCRCTRSRTSLYPAA